MALYLGCCLEIMPTLPAGSVDLILCDLPYGTTACAWDAVIPFDQLWAEYRRLIRGYGAIVLTASQPFTTALIASNLTDFKYNWVWQKNRPGGIFNAKNMPLKMHEDVAVFSPNGAAANNSDRRMTYFPQGLVRINKAVKNSKRFGDETIGNRPSRTGDYIQEFTGYPGSVLSVASESATVHPTQKPVALMEYLIKTYTNEGDTVLDNCMGSGTTGVAAVNLKRRFIGIEKEDAYYHVALNRIGVQHSYPWA